MAPTAITPPLVAVKEDLSVPKTSYLPTMNAKMAATKRKIICFSDFDGLVASSFLSQRFVKIFTIEMLTLKANRTIFMQDTGHILFDAHGCGTKRREILDEQIKTGERSFKEVSEEMWGSLNVPFDDGFEVMEKELEIDPDFREFHKYCIVSISLAILYRRDYFANEICTRITRYLSTSYRLVWSLFWGGC